MRLVRERMIRALWVCAWLSIVAMPARAQSGMAVLNGKIVDQQKATLPGATVTLSNAATGLNRTTMTSADGTYAFPAVPPGRYKLTIELTGFRTATVDPIQLTVDTTTSTDVSMVLGNLNETISVRAETPIINSNDASIGNVIGSAQIQALPLEAQNVVGLLSLQTGVTFVPKANNNTVDPRYGSVSGARADQSNVTLDGVDVNDPLNQTAFTSVLRMTPASVEEFRVTTSSYGADQGRSSGAQVSLVTKSGTNTFNGQGYWVNRNTRFSSNEYFLKLAQVQNDEPSEPPRLDKNIYGGALGGPIKRNRLFFFGNFDGLDEAREIVATRAVPSMALRDGVLVYRCATAGACPGGTVQGLSSSHSVPAGSYGLSPAELRRVDPLGIGPSTAVSQYFRQYPAPNGPGRYPGAIEEYRFAAPVDNTFRTYISRFDGRLGAAQSVFTRLNFQDDAEQSSPQFNGLPSNTVTAGKNWGTAVGWDATLSSTLVNTFRYGFTRIDTTNQGLRSGNLTSFRFIDTPDGQTSTNGRIIDTNNITNDLTLLKGRHTLRTGANLRFVRNASFTNANSFLTGTANASWASGVGRTYRPGGACPAPANCSGLPAVASTGLSSYADSLIPILGVITQTNAVYNYTIDGDVIPFGEPLRRRYGADEFELYLQDSWRVSDTLTLTGGLRYSLFSPPWETTGQQVTTDFSLGDWFDERVANMQAGIPSSASEHITFRPGGKANNGTGFYAWDKNNFAPRLSAAWTPTARWVVRGGYGIVYDRIGAGLATTFDNGGSFGLSNDLDSPFGGFGETAAGVRFVNPGTVPATYPAAPPAGFPAEPETGAGAITLSIDDSVRTPYAHTFNVGVAREFGGNFGVEAAYVGRRGRNLLIRRDMAMPLNLTDPASGLDYFGAARQLIDAYASSGGDVTRIGRIAYWENLFPGAAGGGLTATQAMAESFGGNGPDYITALWLADQFCDPACSRFGPFAYFAEQYDSLAAQSSIGRSTYDALQLTLRRRLSQGYSFDVNYTLSQGKDHGSEVERGAAFGNFGSGGYSGFLVNSFDPDLNYSYSDFDVRHQLNVNFLADLPFGTGRKFGRNANAFVNALVGDWSVAGIGRWSSGFPFNVINCRSCWATNWNLQGNAALAVPGELPEMRTTKNAVDGYPSPFADPEAALEAFRNLYPGEAGIRNLLRGEGYFTLDLALSKQFRMPFNHRLQFRWDVFNVTNTPRFDTGDVTMFPDTAASFGRYDGSLAACDGAASRCMQLNLKYLF
jgi:hypothetical protein